MRGKPNIDLVLSLENFPLEIDNICADTKNKIFKRWGHVGSQAIPEIILKMFPLAQNVHQSLVICHYWWSRLLVKVNWLKHGSSERQFPGGKCTSKHYPSLLFFCVCVSDSYKMLPKPPFYVSLHLYAWNLFPALYADWLPRFMKSGDFLPMCHSFIKEVFVTSSCLFVSKPEV